MAQPTLQEIFGAGATQTETTVTILKADLASVGLIALANNLAEHIFAALIENARLSKLNDTERTADGDVSIVIDEGLPSLQTSGNTRYRVDSRTIELYKPDEELTFNPMKY